MHLARLKLTQFKNYEQQALDLSSRLNCFTGLNGAGKTNLLDAVHYLCLCKSHTGLTDRNLVRHESEFFRLEGRFVRDEAPEKVVIKFLPGQRKDLERNGTPFERLTDYIGQYPVVMVAPDDISLVQEGSEERRRFMDATLSQIFPEYLQHLVAYNALIKQRNALLKTFGEERRFDAILLESLDRQLPAPAALLHDKRAGFIAEVAPLFQEFYAAISGSRETVGMVYDTQMSASAFAEQLAAALEKDRVLQRSTFGPHRDDIQLLMDGQPVKKFASQGQLKSFLLALRLAQYEVLRREKGLAPLLLLDDIFDKLDALRVRQLIELLLSRDFGQIFITDTQRERMEAIMASFGADYRLFEVEQGRVS
ncbi:MAG: DNA replication/repair protein RecF [Saprospiraceae bacterium]|nr:DNA replication/repair protein RecF [Saprospiraceae bacterium]